jgi:hypothetical protein
MRRKINMEQEFVGVIMIVKVKEIVVIGVGVMDKVNVNLINLMIPLLIKIYLKSYTLKVKYLNII